VHEFFGFLIENALELLVKLFELASNAADLVWGIFEAS
jgi:hypothetical protein